MTTTDYYAIVASATTLQLASTPDGAAIDLTSTVPTLTLTEQPPSSNDSIAVLISKELPAANGYSRYLLTNVGAAIAVNDQATKQILWTATASGAGYTYRHVLYLRGGSGVVGSSSGSVAALNSEPAPVTIAAAIPKPIGLTFRLGDG